MKKYLMLCLALGLILALAACSGSGGNTSADTGDGGGDSGDLTEPVTPADAVEVTDVDFGDIQVHEELDRLEFVPGEAVDSVFYKRTTNPEDGSAAYMVKASSKDDFEYLPMDKTVCYVDETLEGRAYYERVPLKYVADGETIETYQYQIFVSAYSYDTGSVIDSDLAADRPLESDTLVGAPEIPEAVEGTEG